MLTVLGFWTDCCDVISIFTRREGCTAQRLRTEDRGQMTRLVLLLPKREARLLHGDADGIMIYMMFTTAAWLL